MGLADESLPMEDKMTRFVFVTLVAGLVGCGKDDCEDTAAGACDTGATEEAEEETEEEEEEEEEEATADSCSFGDTICIEPNEEDNSAWCDGVSGTYAAEACADGSTGSCALPVGGDYTAEATAYYYGDFDGETACNDAGGTYTAAAGGDDAGEEGGDDTGEADAEGEDTGSTEG